MFLKRISLIFILFSLLKIGFRSSEGKVVSDAYPCIYAQAAVDQPTRNRRFVLFPEYHLWLNDWRYIHRAKDIRYWITNYYPNLVSTDVVRSYIHQMFKNINPYINNQIRSVKEGSSVEKSNFHFLFHKYNLCPMNDSSASKENVQTYFPLMIYPPEVIRSSKYRAHGGMYIDRNSPESPISFTKYNTQHEFCSYDDFEYDPVIYHCNRGETFCVIDLYATMLHETFHGFGIEHTKFPPSSSEMRALMDLYATRIPCHDDIRALRKVYQFNVKRSNIKYDNVCRRDFPLTPFQRLIKKLHRFIHFFLYRLFIPISAIEFLLTLIFIYLRACLRRRTFSSDSPAQSIHSSKSVEGIKPPLNAFLWHDDYFNR